MKQIPTGKYKHYKGNFYEVIGFVMHSETREKLVLYKALYDCPELKEEYGDEPLFVRPYSMFTEMVTVNGIIQPRFVFVDEPEIKKV